MKNLKQFNMTILLTSALTWIIASCNPFAKEDVKPDAIAAKSELQKLYEKSLSGRSIIIKGDTIIENSPIKLHTEPEVTDIKNLVSKDGSFRMVSIGGGITAGAKDGGLYRNGQLTSFPNMLMIQMKSKFQQPLLGDKEFNGFGYKVLSSLSNGVPKYKNVSNNLAILKSEPVIELNLYKGEIENWGVPFAGISDARIPKNITIVPNSEFDLSNVYKTRILETISDNIESKILNQKFSFFTIESGLDDFIGSIFSGGHASPCGTLLREQPYIVIMRYANSIQAKGCIANMPDIRDFPFVNFVSPKEIRKVNQSELYAKTSKSVVAVQDACLILPNLLADSLLNPKLGLDRKRGLSFNNPLNADEVYTLDEIENLKNCLESGNNSVIFYAKYFNYPVVDLYSLFKKVASDTYLTNDKIRANNTNFFSSDGIFPSAFGQAIIANEYIKTINEFYKTNIPLINTGFYLNK